LIRRRGDELSGDVVAGVNDSAESKGERKTEESDSDSGSAVITWGWGCVESFTPGALLLGGAMGKCMPDVVVVPLAAFARDFARERGCFGGSGSRKLLKLLKLLVGSKASSSS
jgi:hypothetical protein